MNTKQTINNSEMNSDDIDMLKSVLQKVRGAYPDSPYRQSDFSFDAESEV